MNFRAKVLPSILLLAAVAVPVRSVADTTVKSLRADGNLMLNAADVAAALHYQFKIVDPDRLLTFCKTGEHEICIPVRLAAENHRIVAGEYLIDAELLGRALDFQVRDKDGAISITRTSQGVDRTAREPSPAYNADWGRGRGFRPGDTLPDIPLLNLDGDEVRFSAFLGKRYILYCWASW